MSLEKALEANTAAVLALNDSIQIFITNASIANDRMLAAMARQESTGMPEGGGTQPTPDRTSMSPNEYADAVARQPKKQEEKASAPSRAKAAPVVTAPASTAAEPDAATSTLTYDDIKVPFLNLAKSNLAAAQALIAEFGFKTLKDAKPEQYAEILRALTPDSKEGMA